MEIVAVVGAIAAVAAAIGTVIVALFTWNLARSTDKMAKATLEVASASNAMVQTAQEQVTATLKQVAASQEQVAASRDQLAVAAEQVRATNQQAELARLTLNASIQPLLADVPPGGDPIDESIEFPDQFETKILIRTADRIVVENQGLVVRCSLPLRNVGPGVAVINGAVLMFGTTEVSNPRFTSTIIAPGETTRVSFSITTSQPNRPEVEQDLQTLLTQTFTVRVAYNNAGSSRRIFSDAHVYLDAVAEQHKQYYVRQILLYEAEGYDRDKSLPFAGSGPRFTPQQV